MGTFQITTAEGKKYRVTADTPEAAMGALKKMTAGVQSESHPAFDGSKIPGYNPETGMVEKSKLYSAAEGAADTVTSGFGDELSAGAATLLDKLPGMEGRSYSENLKEIRGDQKAAQEDNPWSYLGGQVGGAVALGLATRGAGFLSGAPTLIPRIVGGAMTGAGYGAAHGLGSGEGLADRAVEAIKEGGTGAVVGGAFPVLAKGVSSAYTGIVNALMGQQAAKKAAVSPEVVRMLGNVLDADGTRGAVGRANMAKAGQDAMLADAGPNAKAILDTAIQRGGPGAVSARRAIAERTDRAGLAVNSALDATLGQPQGVTATRTAIRQGSAAQRGSAYDAAYNAPIDYADPRGMALEQILKTRVPKSAIAAANELMRTEGVSSKQILAKVADDGSVTFETLPDVRQLDYITRGLNEVADQADGAGKLGGTTAQGRAYSNLSGEIRDTLRDLVPEYGKALETAADPIRRSKAVDLGSKLLSLSMTRDQVGEAIRGMTAPERDALAQGIRSHIDDLMANVTRTIQDGDTGAREAIKAIRDLSSRASREKLEMAIGKKKADALFAEMDRAATSFDLRASVTENSKTYARQATDRKISQMTEPGFIGEALEGKPVKATQRIAQLLTGRTPERKMAAQDAVYSQLAKVLTRGGGGAQPVFDAVDKLGQTDAATRLMAERIARQLGGPRLSYPTTILLQDILQDRRRR